MSMLSITNPKLEKTKKTARRKTTTDQRGVVFHKLAARKSWRDINRIILYPKNGTAWPNLHDEFYRQRAHRRLAGGRFQMGLLPNRRQYSRNWRIEIAEPERVRPKKTIKSLA
jgi:hypothetical protein